MSLVAGAIVPHAPVFVASYEGTERAELDRVAAAAAELCLRLRDLAEVVVVVSPHAATSGVYEPADGDLLPFGLGALEITLTRDGPLALALSDAWKRDALRARLDHGVVVPLRAGWVPDRPSVAIGLAEMTGPTPPSPAADALHDASDLASTLRSIAMERDIVVVASAHLGAALDERAPLGSDPEAIELEKAVLSKLGRDVGTANELLGSLAETGSCGAGPLRVLAELFGARPLTRLAYEAPFGVGYLVGIVE